MSARPAPSLGWTVGRELDRLLEHRSRLGACVLLSQADSLSFRRLKDLLDETDGNLGAHLNKLKDAGYVRSTKSVVDGRPVTWFAITKPGRKKLNRHLDALDQIIHDLRNVEV